VEQRHYFQLKGARAEAVIHALATDTFFTDWCYPNPKRPNGEELCDLPVAFDDTAIIWQIKDLKVDEHGYYKKAEVEKNLRQLGGARRTLFELKAPVTLSNPRRGAETFDPATVKHVHLISVLMGEGQEEMPIMTEINGHVLHVFTREFSDVALRELDTIADFCRYLRQKEALYGRKRVLVFGGEENLLGKYIELGRNFDWMTGHDKVIIEDSVWQKVQTMPQFIEKKLLDRISYGWDSMIDRAHEGSERYEIVARELARPDRFSRRLLSRWFMEAYDDFMRSEGDMVRRMSTHLDTTYCFLVTNDPAHGSERSRNILRAMCFVARGLRMENQKVIGVSTTQMNRGYDFLLLVKPGWTAEDEALKAQLQEAYGVFKNPRMFETTESEYPPLRTG